LPLPAGTVPWEYQTACDGGTDLGAVVTAHEVQSEVERRGAACRGENVSVVDEQHLVVDAHPRIPPAELVGPLPVHGDAPPVRDSRFGQRERPGTHPDQPRTPRVGTADGLQHVGTMRTRGVGAVRDDDRVRMLQCRQAGDVGHGEETLPHSHGRSPGAQVQVVEQPADLGSVDPEHLGQAGQLEGVRALVDEHAHDVTVPPARSGTANARCILTPRVRGILRHALFLALSAPACKTQDRIMSTTRNNATNVDAVLASFDEHWSPRILTRVNDYDVRVAKMEGTFVWHSHPDTDELFVVLDGRLDTRLRQDGTESVVHLARHDVFVVPRGVEH